jgi:uncharacterized protein YqjF (DUF2071 family)
MFSALNHRAEAATASRIEAQPITPCAPERLEHPSMRQTWKRLTFLHWPFDPPLIRPLLPKGLELDTFDNAAWVGLVPFEIYNFPGLLNFPETNVRTYVVGPDGSRAVWFFSLDAARLLAVIGARVAYGLPYFWSSMRVTSEGGGAVRYRSRRKWPHASKATSNILVKPGDRFRAEELGDRDHFLTARFRLYSLVRGKLGCAQIEHEPWPLARASVRELDQTLIESSGLAAPRGAPLVHYCEELNVRIGFLAT